MVDEETKRGETWMGERERGGGVCEVFVEGRAREDEAKSKVSIGTAKSEIASDSCGSRYLAREEVH